MLLEEITCNGIFLWNDNVVRSRRNSCFVNNVHGIQRKMNECEEEEEEEDDQLHRYFKK